MNYRISSYVNIKFEYIIICSYEIGMGKIDLFGKKKPRLSSLGKQTTTRNSYYLDNAFSF